MPNDPKSVWQSFVSRGSTDREALFKTFEHYNELHWKNYQQLRGEVDVLKQQLKALEAGKAAE